MKVNGRDINFKQLTITAKIQFSYYFIQLILFIFYTPAFYENNKRSGHLFSTIYGE